MDLRTNHGQQRKNKLIGYTTGTFDLTHQGHFQILKYIKSQCDFLIVGLTTDELGTLQKRKPILSFEHRKSILENCKWVDEVVGHDGDDKQTAWHKIKFDILFIGEDYYEKEEYKLFTHAPVIYVNTGCKVRTSKIIRRLEDRFLDTMQLLAHGISGPIQHFCTKDNNVVLKTINMAFKETQCGTGNAYNLPIPPPRNWKVKGLEHKYPNISGINAQRELGIHLFIQHKPWNPVLKSRLVYENYKYICEDHKDIVDVSLDRNTPCKVYWLYQNYAGDNINELLKELGDDPSAETFLFIQNIVLQVFQICQELKSLKIVHGDIHGNNTCVLYDSETQDVHVNLIDFGWCMHPTFDMDEKEMKYFKYTLENNFDFIHFYQSVKFDFDHKSWWSRLDQFFHSLCSELDWHTSFHDDASSTSTSF